MIKRLLPPPPRFLPGQRWLNIGLRCAHLVGIAGVGGGFLFALPEPLWLGYWHLALVSGGLLALLYFWTDFNWLLQLKGQVILFKLALLALANFYPAWRTEAYVLIVALSGLFAHAPAWLRGWAWGLPVRVCGTVTIKDITK